MSGLYGNAVMAPAALKTVILQDESGNEMATGIVVGEKTVFTATDNDVRTGLVYAGDDGLSTGTKDIPSYNTYAGYKIIEANSEFKIILSTLDLYDYTKLQCIICPYNTSVSDSVISEKVVIDSNVYQVNSSTVVSSVTKDVNEKAINFGITNDTSRKYIIRFFMYKEIV